jgi:membrane protease subunit (stomatin/prohibitin family)
MDLLTAIKESIVAIEKMQNDITALQSSGLSLSAEVNLLLDQQWVRLQQTWELAHQRRAELEQMQW